MDDKQSQNDDRERQRTRAGGGGRGGEETRPGPAVWFRREKKRGRASALDYLFCFVFFFAHFCQVLLYGRRELCGTLKPVESSELVNVSA